MSEPNTAVFPRCNDAQFWADKERVEKLIELYKEKCCLWNVKSSEYKNVAKKKVAKMEIGQHFGLTGMFFICIM